MAINLRDIPDAVRSYLDNKVTVRVNPIIPATGAALGPNETFSFSVSAQNTNAANGGIPLSNVFYRVRVENPAVAKFAIPAANLGSATDDSGNVLSPGTQVGFMVFRPIGDLRSLSVGETDTLTLNGRAAAAPPTGGTTTIAARIVADVDVDQLFPKGENSPATSRTITVTG